MSELRHLARDEKREPAGRVASQLYVMPFLGYTFMKALRYELIHAATYEELDIHLRVILSLMNIMSCAQPALNIEAEKVTHFEGSESPETISNNLSGGIDFCAPS